MRSIFPVTLLLLWLLFPGGTQGAEGLPGALAKAESDLRQALDELATVNQQIVDEKIPLLQTRNKLEDEVLGKRRELDGLRRANDNELVELNALRSEIKKRRDELGYVSSLLGEYGRAFETRIHPSEAVQFDELIQAATAANDDAEAGAFEFAPKVKLAEAGVARLKRLLGGDKFAGRALDDNGTLQQGQFALIGPVAVFAADAGDVAGLAELRLGSAEPAVISLDPEINKGIASLINSGSGLLPVDPTLGSALKVRATEETILEHIAKGGPVMIPILLFGILALVVAIAKWIQIRRLPMASAQDLESILNAVEKDDRERATSEAKRIGGPVGDMLEAAIRSLDGPKEHVEEVMYERMLVAKPQLEKWITVITLAAATAPLLGLLGTVTGMINTFKVITVFGTGDPKTLAGGISEALITTEFGLIVAVPALLMSAFISRKAKATLHNMERTAVAFINGTLEKGENQYA